MFHFSLATMGIAAAATVADGKQALRAIAGMRRGARLLIL